MCGSFDNLNLDPSLIRALEIGNIRVPTDIQAKAIPPILGKRDTVVQSETGTGKTLAYLLPLFERFKPLTRDLKVLILAPTHELVIQIQRQMQTLSQDSGLNIRTLTLIGDSNISRQLDKLKDKPRIVVGSAGRMLEMVKRQKIRMQTVQAIVLDEADQLLDSDNSTPVLSIIRNTGKDCQLIMVSASFSQKSLDMSQEIMHDPVIIRSTSHETIPASITHVFLHIEQRDKIEVIRKMINIFNPPKSLIFLNKAGMIRELEDKLRFHNIRTDTLCGTGAKDERKKALDDFRSGRLKVLIASDLAARGLHIEGVTHIFNMDIPEEPKGYLHRAGRTGRMGSPGAVISLASGYELPFLKRTEKMLGITLEEKVFAYGELSSRPRSPV